MSQSRSLKDILKDDQNFEGELTAKTTWGKGTLSKTTTCQAIFKVLVAAEKSGKLKATINIKGHPSNSRISCPVSEAEINADLEVNGNEVTAEGVLPIINKKITHTVTVKKEEDGTLSTETSLLNARLAGSLWSTTPAVVEPVPSALPKENTSHNSSATTATTESKSNSTKGYFGIRLGKWL